MNKFCFIFNEGNVLLKVADDGKCTIPENPKDKGLPYPESEIIEVNCGVPNLKIMAYRTKDTATGSDYKWVGLRQSYYKLSPSIYQIAGKCAELLYWDAHTQYCGTCGHKMIWHSPISKQCTHCQKQIWPSPAPAIIVLIHRGKEVLLVHAKNFRGDFFGLVAGFVETGENLEEAVIREVKEETGLSIKNLRYFGSQPWPYPFGLMLGFNADYDSGELHLQYEELEKGSWFQKDDMPTIPEKLSIARKLIDAWLAEEV